MNLTPEQEREIAEAMKEVADKGMLVAAGFAAFRIIALNNSIDRDKIADMHTAYMAGAEHLFTTLMSILDEGEEPTKKDTDRIELIYQELQAWRAKMVEQHGWVAR